MDAPPRHFRSDDSSDRLDSWKEIAAYLRRDVRTVQRWEARNGLPVYRHSPEPLKGSPVHAYRSELDAWLRTHGEAASGDGPAHLDNSAAHAVQTGLLLLPPVNLTLPRRGSRFTGSVRGTPAQSVQGSPDRTTGDPRNSDAESDGPSAPDPIACGEYALGRRYLEDVRNSDEATRARAHLERAIALHPGFAAAHEALARLHWFLGYLGLEAPKEAFATAVVHAIRALEIDGTRAETHALLGQIQKQVDYNWSEIERAHKNAQELAPDSTFVQLMYASGWLMPHGRLGEAITTLERVLERDPLSKWANEWLGILLALARDWDRTIAGSQLMIELDPVSPFGHWLLGVGLRGKGFVEEAILEHRRAVDLSGGWPFLLGWLGLMLGVGGKDDEARQVLHRLQGLARTAYVPPSSFAWVHLGLREIDSAFAWLDRAVEERDQLMMPITSYAFLDPIRPDSRFATLLRKMKLD